MLDSDTSTSTELVDATPLNIKRAHAGSASVRTARALAPHTTDEVSEHVRALADSGIPFTVVGGRSNVIGAFAAEVDVAVSTRNLTTILALDDPSHLVTVGAGMLGGELERRLNEKGLTLGQYPQSLHIATVGGWVSTRASGALSARNGGIEQAVKGATAVLADGSVVHFGPRTRAPGGLDALSVLIGTEGSVAVLTEVTLEVRRLLPERKGCFLIQDLAAVVEAQRSLMQNGYPVALLRGYNSTETDHVLGYDADGRNLLMTSTTGPEDLIDAQYAAMARHLVELGAAELDSSAADRWYDERYRVETMMVDRNASPGRAFDTIEVSVPWSSAAECASTLEREMSSLSSPFYLHFSHAYESGVCFYSLLWLEADDDSAVIEAMHDAWTRVLTIVADHGGTFGHHHGIGSVRADRYGETDDARIHRALKAALDPHDLLRSGVSAALG